MSISKLRPRKRGFEAVPGKIVIGLTFNKRFLTLRKEKEKKTIAQKKRLVYIPTRDPSHLAHLAVGSAGGLAQEVEPASGM